MAGSTVQLVVLMAALQVGVILGQAPFLKTENQCGALYDRKLFHVCSASASLRSARDVTHRDPFADAVMNNAQNLLDKAALLLGRTPSKLDAKGATPVHAPAKSDAVRDDAKPSLVNQLKHAAQTLSVSSCIIQNSVEVLNDAIRALEGGGVQPLPDAVPTTEAPMAVPVVEAAVVQAPVAKDPMADRPIAAPARPPPSGGRPPGGRPSGGRPSGGRPSGGRPPGGQPSVSVDVLVNGQPVNVAPVIQVSQSSNSGSQNQGPPKPRPPRPNPRPPQANDPLPAEEAAADTSLSGMEKLEFLNGKVHTLSKQVADLLTDLGANLVKPVRSQSFHNLARAPLEEIQQIQLVLARSEGAEMEDEVEAEGVIRDLQRQQEQLKKLFDSPDELKERLQQPKDRNFSQALVTDLKALKATLTKVLPLPQDLY